MKKPQKKFLKHYQPPCYYVERINLDFDLYDDHALVHSRLELRRNKDVGADGFPTLTLDGRELELVSLHRDGVLLSSGEYTIHN